MSEAPKKKSPFIALGAGCIAGGMEACAVWPMEFIKTQLQLAPKGSLPYDGMVSGLRHTVQSTGFLSLYRGLLPTLIGSMPKAGIRFGLNTEFKGRLKDADGKLTPGKNFIAGMGAGIGEAFSKSAKIFRLYFRVLSCFCSTLLFSNLFAISCFVYLFIILNSDCCSRRDSKNKMC